jgi:hypothetical protein
VIHAHGDVVTQRDPTLGWRYAAAAAGLAIIGYFAFQLYLTPHLDRVFKFVSVAVIIAIGVVGAGAVVQREQTDAAEGERLYTAAEVAALVHAARCPHCGRAPSDLTRP